MTADKINKRKLPLVYRLILRLPKPNLDFLPGVFHGIFWAVIVPVFILLEAFLIIFLIEAFPFPVNAFLIGSIPAIVFIIFLRIQLERYINLMNASIAQEGLEWNIEKVTKEYMELMKKRKSQKNEKS